MNAFRHILVAIDFTMPCRTALREAARQASLSGAALTAVHVMDEFLAHEMKRGLSATKEVILDQMHGYLKKFIIESDVGAVQAGMDVVIGNPSARLVEACRRHGADLLIMGAHGSDARSARVGPVAVHCIRKAPAEVLVVREESAGPFKRILACVDFSENSAKAVRCALSMAARDGASLDCLHVYQSALAMTMEYNGLGMMPYYPVEPAENIFSDREKELRSFVDHLLKGSAVPVSFHVVERVNIREAVQEHVLASNADLVVLGTRGKSGLRELLMGTTAEKIISQAPCSILAVKPDELCRAEIGE